MKKLYTIGFTKKSAKEFFELLKDNSIELLADIRLNNSSQLAGFTKKEDLEFFLSLVGISYEHWLELAPTKEIFDKYKNDKDWSELEKAYKHNIALDASLIEKKIPTILEKKVCLLCSEPKPEKCHRRLLAEMIAEKIEGLELVHL